MRSDNRSTRVLDASALVNLAAMRDPILLLQQVDAVWITPRVSVKEVRKLRHPDRSALSPAEWIARTVEVVDLSNAELELFGHLVGATEPEDVGDGEAAVLAVAVLRGGIAVLDDAKPIQIARSLSPPVPTCSTVALLHELWEQNQQNHDLIRMSLIDALLFARMAIADEYLEWMAEVIPLETRRLMSSLPRWMRSSTVRPIKM